MLRLERRKKFMCFFRPLWTALKIHRQRSSRELAEELPGEVRRKSGKSSVISRSSGEPDSLPATRQIKREQQEELDKSCKKAFNMLVTILFLCVLSRFLTNSNKFHRAETKGQFFTGDRFRKRGAEFLLLSMGEGLGSASGRWWGVVFLWKLRETGMGVGRVGRGVGTDKGTGKLMRSARLCQTTL